MKNIYVVFILLAISNLTCAQQNKDTLFVAHWNLENLFDTIDDPKTEDEEFLPSGSKEWTDERFDKKLYNLSRVIRSMNDDNGPDLLGVCEVEHQAILDTMISKFLSDKSYKTAYLESPDGRGIDNGIIYNSNRFRLLNVKGLTIDIGGGYNTRLILEGKFLFETKDTLYFFVNHWPSRRGGESESEPRRIKAAKSLREEVESILAINGKSKIIIVGDFNDEPTNVSITEYLKAQPFFCDSLDLENLPEDFGTDLFNLSYKAWFDGLGSYKYKDDFNMLDQIIISKVLLLEDDLKYVCNSFEVYKPYLMVTRTGKYQGTPFPTYGGSRYLGGYSDHFPVIAKFLIEQN
ncbi:MAG: endonuclease/exonuclease/phosphatase family protein [Ignavibacteriota bacterium]